MTAFRTLSYCMKHADRRTCAEVLYALREFTGWLSWEMESSLAQAEREMNCRLGMGYQRIPASLRKIDRLNS